MDEGQHTGSPYDRVPIGPVPINLVPINQGQSIVSPNERMNEMWRADRTTAHLQFPLTGAPSISYIHLK